MKVGVPERPAPPRLLESTDTSLKVGWDVPLNNGAPILFYVLEMDTGVVAGANFNEIYRGTKHLSLRSVANVVLLHREGKKRSYEVKRLTPGTTYHFLVKAANKYGAGGFSRVASFMTQGSAPKKKGLFPLTPKVLKRFFLNTFLFVGGNKGPAENGVPASGKKKKRRAKKKQAAENGTPAAGPSQGKEHIEEVLDKDTQMDSTNESEDTKAKGKQQTKQEPAKEKEKKGTEEKEKSKQGGGDTKKEPEGKNGPKASNTARTEPTQKPKQNEEKNKQSEEKAKQNTEKTKQTNAKPKEEKGKQTNAKPTPTQSQTNPSKQKPSTNELKETTEEKENPKAGKQKQSAQDAKQQPKQQPQGQPPSSQNSQSKPKPKPQPVENGKTDGVKTKKQEEKGKAEKEKEKEKETRTEKDNQKAKAAGTSDAAKGSITQKGGKGTEGTKEVKVETDRRQTGNDEDSEDKNEDRDDGTVVRLRGLPWEVTKEDIIKFFAGLSIAGKDGICIALNFDARPTGDGFVRFVNAEQVNNNQTKSANANNFIKPKKKIKNTKTTGQSSTVAAYELHGKTLYMCREEYCSGLQFLFAICKDNFGPQTPSDGRCHEGKTSYRDLDRETRRRKWCRCSLGPSA